MGDKIKFAVLGLGNIGIRHMNTIQNHPDCELVAVCDLAPPKELPIQIPFFTDLEKMLAEIKDCNVVNICTPNGFHARHANTCIAAGKHVVIEKPMALHKVDAEKVIFNALNYDVKVFCVMQNRLTPVAKFLKNLIDNHELGEILELSLILNWNRGRDYYISGDKDHDWHGSKSLDGGPLFTQFSHFIDLLYWLVGDIEVLSVLKRNLMHPFAHGIEDCGVVSFGFGEKGIGSLYYSINAPYGNMISQVSITGDQGSIIIEGQYLEQIKYLKTGTIKEIPVLEPNAEDGHYQVIDNVVKSIMNQTAINTNALEGMKVVEIIEKIYNFPRNI